MNGNKTEGVVTPTAPQQLLNERKWLHKYINKKQKDEIHGAEKTLTRSFHVEKDARNVSCIF